MRCRLACHRTVEQMRNRCERISGRYQIDSNSTGTDDKSNRADSEVKVAAIARAPAGVAYTTRTCTVSSCDIDSKFAVCKSQTCARQLPFPV